MTIENTKKQLRELTEAQNRVISEIMEMGLSVESVIDDVELADLLRFVQGQIQYASLIYFHNSDASQPRLINTQYPAWNWGVSNPDTLYASAAISDQNEYRVFGRLGTASESTFGVYSGIGADSEAVKLNAKDIHVENDGSFEIFITKEKRGKNWIESLPGMESFASYQVFGKWNEQEKGLIYIECLNTDVIEKPRGMQETRETFEAYLQRLKENFELWVLHIPAFIYNSMDDNGMLGPFQPPSAQEGTYFTSVKWELNPGEALLIDMNVEKDCSYSSISLTNRWSQMLDIDTRQTSLNHGQWIDKGDGTVSVLLSTKDLGVKNWLDASGYSKGLATWRITQAEQPEAPIVKVIKEEDVDTYFSDDLKVTRSQRSEDLIKRREHFRKLYSI